MGLYMRENREKCMFDSMCYPHNQELVLFVYHTGGGEAHLLRAAPTFQGVLLKRGKMTWRKY